MSKIWDVLVVGAGPVGLFCANEVARYGLSCRIVDKKSELSDKSKALALHARTLDLFEDCGEIDEILAQGHKVDEVLFKANGKTFARLDFQGIEANRQYIIDLAQDKTEHILAAALKKKHINIDWQTELTKVTQTKTGVSATLVKGGGESEVVQASWLIACDGPHSTVRQILNVPFIGSEYKQDWWLADLIVKWKLPENTMVMYPTTKGPLACFPMGNKRYRLVMLAPSGHEEMPTLKDIQAVFKERSLDKAVLSDPIWITKFYLHHRLIGQYRKKSIFFAGDSAHIHSPLGGQGLNMGIQDAYNLVWKIALVHRKLAKPSLLDSYHIERHPIGEEMIRKTDRATKMILLNKPFLVKIRNAFMSCFMKMEFIRKKVAYGMAELNISYAKSPIVANLGSLKGLKVGTFPRDFDLYDLKNKKHPLHQIVQGTQHHLFLFTGINQPDIQSLEKIVKAITKAYPKVIVPHIVLNQTKDKIVSSAHLWIDKDQKVHQHYGVNKPAAVLIRPDKYVGLTQVPLKQATLLAYFAKIFIKT